MNGSTPTSILPSNGSGFNCNRLTATIFFLHDTFFHPENRKKNLHVTNTCLDTSDPRHRTCVALPVARLPVRRFSHRRLGTCPGRGTVIALSLRIRPPCSTCFPSRKNCIPDCSVGDQLRISVRFYFAGRSFLPFFVRRTGRRCCCCRFGMHRAAGWPRTTSGRTAEHGTVIPAASSGSAVYRLRRSGGKRAHLRGVLYEDLADRTRH